jgi:hypothetical protein
MAKKVLALFWRFWVLSCVALLVLTLLPPFLELDQRLLGAGAPAEQAVVQGPLKPWPIDGEAVADLTPTLRWPSVEPGWTVHIYQQRVDGQLVWVASIPADPGRLEVPPGVLEADAAYVWTVMAGATEPSPVAFSGNFTTRQRLVAGPLSVAPAVFRIGLETLLSGQEIDVEAPAGAPVEMQLPEVLTLGGQSKLMVTGGFSARVQVSVRFSQVDADALARGLGHIRLRLGAHVVSVPVELDVSRLGMPEEVVQTGFDPVMDTPGFSNFTGGTLSQLTRGTCLGMVLASRQKFRECVQCSRLQDCLCMRMRLESLVGEERVRERMSFLHLANLEPRNWSIAVTTLSGTEGRGNLTSRLLERLRSGDPVPVAMLSAARVDPARPESNLGHAVLAYGAILFTDTVVIFTYDPDEIPGGDRPLTAFLWGKRKGDSRFRRADAGGSVPIQAHLLPDTPLLAGLPEGLTRTVAALDQGFARAVEGK